MPSRLYMQYGDAFFSSGARLWMAVAAMFLVAGVVKGAIGLGLPTISTMLEKHRLAAVVLGTRLCSIVPAATYAQDKLERFQEQPRIIDGRLLAAVTATLKTTPATGVAVGEVARANLAGHTGIEVQLLRLLPLRAGADPGLSDLIEQTDRTEVVVTLNSQRANRVSNISISPRIAGSLLNVSSRSNCGSLRQSLQ